MFQLSYDNVGVGSIKKISPTHDNMSQVGECELPFSAPSQVLWIIKTWDYKLGKSI